jgi:hypothetical protein
MMRMSIVASGTFLSLRRYAGKACEDSAAWGLPEGMSLTDAQLAHLEQSFVAPLSSFTDYASESKKLYALRQSYEDRVRNVLQPNRAKRKSRSK